MGDFTPVLKENYKKTKIQHFEDGGVVMPEMSAEDSALLDSALDPIPQSQQSTPVSSTGIMSAEDSALLDSELAPELRAEKYGTPGQMLKTAAEGIAQGVAGPLATAAEVGLGIATPEDIRGREEENPITHGVAEAGAFGASMLGGVGEAKLLAQAGEAASKLATKDIGRMALDGATQWGLLQAGDEVSKMIKEDPEASMDSAIAHVGMSSVLGGGLGAALGTISPLWKAVSESKVGQALEDMKGRLHQKINQPDPATAIYDELSPYMDQMSELTEKVHGPSGLKAEELSKLMPEMSDKVVNHSMDISSKLEKALDKMAKEPASYPERLRARLKGDLDAYNEKITAPETGTGEMFNAAQDLKQSLQTYAKYDRMIKPVDEAYDFIRTAKNLAHDLKESLEDTRVWGKAGHRQAEINKATSEYIPALKDAQKTFMGEVGGVKVLDKGKIETYVNQLGKANAEIKQEKLKNFLDASEKYQKALEKTHEALGIESPVTRTPLTATRGSLDERTLGAKLADSLLKKIPELGSEGIGSAVGAGIGHSVAGDPGAILGGLLGRHVLGHALDGPIHSILEKLLTSKSSGVGFKAALDYAQAVGKGAMATSVAVKNIFKDGITENHSSVPTEKERAKLIKAVNAAKENPELLLNSQSHLHHYMDRHEMARGKAVGNVVGYLASIAPENQPRMPLDAKLPVSQAQKASYDKALNIAEKPLIVLDKVKNGTITQQDMVHLRSMYPALYPQIATKITGELINAQHKGLLVPYKTRVGLSIFLGKPMDSTMTPAAIQAAQMKAPQSQPETAQMPASGAKHSMTSLNKLPGMYKTPGQSRAASRQRED